MRILLKTIYRLLPFKGAVFTALKLFWIPSERLYKHLHFKGIFTVKINSTKKFKINHFGFWIENEIFWKGFANSWEKESLKLWSKLCEESKVIIDIGANTGVYSLVAKTINPKAKVYSFEPQSMFFESLLKNISLNQFDIQAFKTAVSDHDGEVIIDDYSGKTKSINVECITLDSFVKTHDLNNIDLIKIDVEMHEPQVLAGFSNYLIQFKPTLLIEILNAEIANIVYDNVKDMGYLYFNIDEKGKIRQTEKIEPSDYYNYLLCSADVAKKIGLKTF